MAHRYRKLKEWNQWLSEHFLGNHLLKAEACCLSSLLQNHFGKHVVLLGVPHQADLFSATEVPCHTLICPWSNRSKKALHIEADFKELPIFSGSVDLVLMPHTLEFVDNSRQLLAEACRIVKPEGLIVMVGFNPYSWWGLNHHIFKKKFHWEGNLLPAAKIKAWLKLADFELEQQKTILFTPPINQRRAFQQLSKAEKLINLLFPCLGNVYILIARAKVIPLTPIKLQWKQHLSGIRISPTISTHMRQEKSKQKR